MDSVIATMSVRLRKCKGRVAILLASQKRLQEELNRNINMVTQYQVKALAAVGRGEDELARDLLRKKKRYEETVKKLKGDLLKHKRASDSLMELVRQLELKLEETKRNKLLLLTQKECYETSQVIEDGFAGDDELAIQDVLENLEDDVNTLKFASQVGVEIESEALDHEDDPLALPEDAGDSIVEPKSGSELLEDELDALRERLQANPELLEEATNSQVLHMGAPEEEEDDYEDEEPEEEGIQILSSSDEPDDESEPPPPRKRKKAKAPAPEEDEEDDGIIFIT